MRGTGREGGRYSAGVKSSCANAAFILELILEKTLLQVGRQQGRAACRHHTSAAAAQGGQLCYYVGIDYRKTVRFGFESSNMLYPLLAKSSIIKTLFQ